MWILSPILYALHYLMLSYLTCHVAFITRECYLFQLIPQVGNMIVFALSVMLAKYIAAEDEYVLNFDSSIYVCVDDVSQSVLDTSEIEIRRHNESTAVMTGAVTFMKEIGQRTMVELVVEKDVFGSFEMVLSREICDLCKEISDPESFYYDYLKFFGFPNECPIEPKTYHVSEFVANTKKVQINKAHEGRYQVTLNIWKNLSDECDTATDKTFIACLKLDVLIESSA